MRFKNINKQPRVESMNAAFEKIVRLGTKLIDTGLSNVQRDIFCKIEYSKDGRLSITGVEGPFTNGNAAGGCGQIGDHLDIELHAPDWSPEMVTKFANIWDKWHLNDMTPNCEHQTGPEWTPKDVEIVDYILETATSSEQKAVTKAVLDRLLKGETVTLSEAEKSLLELPLSTKTAPDADSYASGCYSVYKREMKSTNWLSESQHPDGYLSKPCPVCGYKYGSKWLKVEVPADVLEWLQALPDTDKKPAWV